LPGMPDPDERLKETVCAMERLERSTAKADSWIAFVRAFELVTIRERSFDPF
jgi:hypothetical protein